MQKDETAKNNRDQTNHFIVDSFQRIHVFYFCMRRDQKEELDWRKYAKQKCSFFNHTGKVVDQVDEYYDWEVATSGAWVGTMENGLQKSDNEV